MNYLIEKKIIDINCILPFYGAFVSLRDGGFFSLTLSLFVVGVQRNRELVAIGETADTIPREIDVVDKITFASVFKMI